jgi:hypothetical protein
MRHASLVLLASALFACSSAGGSGGADGGATNPFSSSGSSSGGGGSSSGGGGTTSTSIGGFSLAVNAVTEPPAIGTLTPNGGDLWVVVDLTLANTGSAAPLSVDPVLFSLQTSQSLVVTASPASVASECSPTVSVASGGHLECKVAFEVPDSQTPSALLYDDQRGDRATTTLPPVDTSAAACSTVSGWLFGSTKQTTTCIDCIGRALGFLDAGTGPCTSLADSYQQQCGSACGNQCSLGGTTVVPDPKTCACQQLFDQTMACEVTACSSSCP